MAWRTAGRVTSVHVVTSLAVAAIWTLHPVRAFLFQERPPRVLEFTPVGGGFLLVILLRLPD